MSEEVNHARPDLSLSELEDWLWDSEQLLGPVTAIEAKAAPDRTTAAFQWTGDTPIVKARIRLLVDGQPVVPTGATTVCRGTAYVSGARTQIVVYRPN